MKKYIVTFAFGVMLSFIPVATAQVATDQLPWKAQIPFKFHVGKQILPAGTYIVRWNSGSLQMASVDGSAAVKMLPLQSEDRKTNTESQMVFSSYGGEVFLNKIQFAGQREHRELPKSKLEIEYAKQGSPGSEIVVAEGDPGAQNGEVRLQP